MGPSSFNVSAISSISTRVRSGCCAAPNEASHPLLLRPTLGIVMRPAPAASALNAASEIRSCCPPASSASGRRPGTHAAEGADAAAVAPLRTARASLAPKATIKCQNLHSRGQRRSMLPKPKQSEREDRVDCTGACLDSSRQGIYIPSAPDACSGVRSSAHLDPPTSGEGKPPETTSPQSCPAATLRERGGPYRRQGRQFFCTTTTQWVGLETGTFGIEGEHPNHYTTCLTSRRTDR